MAELSTDRARYIAVPESWTDIPEAEPRCRVRMPEGLMPCAVRVDEDGELIYADESVLIDYYDAPPPDRPGDAPGTQAERYASIRERREPEL